MFHPQETKMTADELRCVLKYNFETGVFIWVAKTNMGRDRTNTVAGCISPRDGYARITIKRRSYLAHRLAWAVYYGEWPTEQIDHINRNRADNRIANLRLATQAQNTQNTPLYKNNKSGAKGVYRHAWGKWEAYISVNRKRLYLGVYSTFDEAIQARTRAQATYFTHAETPL